jgi:hypothetical protein
LADLYWQGGSPVILIAMSLCLLASLGLNVLLVLLNNSHQQRAMDLLARKEGIMLPSDQVVQTATDLVARHVNRRREQPRQRFSVPLPGTEWMQKAKES